MALVAYHGKKKEKTSILSQLRKHRKANQIVQDYYGHWRKGKGGAVGCTLHSDNINEYEKRFGIPVALAHLKYRIFEELPRDLADQWPERFMAAVQPGQDLSTVRWNLMCWLLTDPDVNPGITNRMVSKPVEMCAALMKRISNGDNVPRMEINMARARAREGRKVAERKMKVARKSIWEATEQKKKEEAEREENEAWFAVRSAAGAENALDIYTLESSAFSAAWVAERNQYDELSSKEEKEVWVKISDKLISLIAEAPMAEQL